VKATKGPWSNVHTVILAGDGLGDFPAIASLVTATNSDANAAHIAGCSPEVVIALLDVVEAAQKYINVVDELRVQMISGINSEEDSANFFNLRAASDTTEDALRTSLSALVGASSPSDIGGGGGRG
jgi:hypothetical protein